MKNFISEFVKLIVGNKFNINKLLLIEDTDKKIDINFDGTDLEDKYEDIEELADEKIEIFKKLDKNYTVKDGKVYYK